MGIYLTFLDLSLYEIIELFEALMKQIFNISINEKY